MYKALPLIQGSTVAATATPYYTVPNGTTTRITQFSLTNNDTVNRIVSIYLTPTTAAPVTTDLIIKNKTIAAGETWVPYQALGSTLSAGGCIQIVADAAGVIVAKASGIELS